MKTLITVIVPVYNVESYLPRLLASINSALKHTGNADDFEVIFINDGSTDNSRQLLQADCLPSPLGMVTRVAERNNGGASAARNIGLDMARGRWITFIDADDCISDSYLTDMRKYALKADASVTFIATGYTTFDDAGTVRRHPLSTSPGYDATLMSMPTFACTKLFRTDSIRKSGIYFDPLLKAGEDAQFLFDYWGANPGKVLFINQEGYLYYQRPGSLTRQNRVDYTGKLRDYRNFRRSLLNCIAENSLSETVWRHWRKMTGHDLYELISDLRISGGKPPGIIATLARDFTDEEMSDLDYFPCNALRKFLNSILLLRVKRQRKRTACRNNPGITQ